MCWKRFPWLFRNRSTDRLSKLLSASWRFSSLARLAKILNVWFVYDFPHKTTHLLFRLLIKLFWRKRVFNWYVAEKVSTDSEVIWLFLSSIRSNADECAKNPSGIDLIELLCNKSTRSLVSPRTSFGGSFLMELKVRSMLVKSLFSANRSS